VRLEFSTLVPLARKAVFAFHANPGNLAVLHRGWDRLRVLHHDASLEPGSQTWIEQTVGGVLPVVLGFRHTGVGAPEWSEETLIHGPWRRFVHRHEFVDLGESTLVRDRITVELPWFWGAEVGMRWFVANLIRRSFARRGAALIELARSGALTQA